MAYVLAEAQMIFLRSYADTGSLVNRFNLCRSDFDPDIKPSINMPYE